VRCEHAALVEITGPDSDLGWRTPGLLRVVGWLGAGLVWPNQQFN
jgi:hypothetical protein